MTGRPPPVGRGAAVVAVVLGAVSTACVAPPPAEVPDVAPLEASLGTDDVAVRRDGIERRLRDGTLRVRARGCLGVRSGSAFAVDDHILATNRHVVEGADLVQVSTWHGESIDVEITGVALANDLAIASTRQALPGVLPQAPEPPPGTEVAVVGYPGGEAIDIAWGQVRDYVDGAPFGESQTTMRVDARVVPGNSGGPLVDRDGNVVGVVFAIERATGDGLVVPIGALQRAAARRDGFFANPSPC